MNRFTGLVVLLLPFDAWADVVGPIDSVENFVNIRISADSTSEVVGRLRQGDYLPLISTDEDWLEIDITGGATGFVSADWVVVYAEIPGTSEQQDAIASDDETVEESTVDLVSAEIVAELNGEPVEQNAEDDAPIPLVDASSDPIVEQTEEDVSVTTAADESSDVSPELEALADENNGRTGIDEMRANTDTEVEIAIDDDFAEELVGAVEADAEIAVEIDADLNGADDELDAISPDIENVVAEADVLAVPESEDTLVQSDTAAIAGLPGLMGPPGPKGDPGPPGPPGAATIEGSVGYLTRFSAPTVGASSQVYDDGNNIGIGTTTPVQRLEVNGNIQIHEQNSSVAGLMITQSDGETGYIMHNRASTLTIGAGSIDRITIDADGNVGFGIARPTHPIEMASGAHVTAGGVWTNSSSRSRKENIATLSADDALAALIELKPVQYNYKNDQVERYVGFIAEDVPDLVATEDRDGLSAMDIVAVLTKVVQEQQMKIEALEARLDQR